MSCACKNKEYHPCQHGKPCECGGKCKEDNYFNVVSSIDEFKDESKSIKGRISRRVVGASSNDKKKSK